MFVKALQGELAGLRAEETKPRLFENFLLFGQKSAAKGLSTLAIRLRLLLSYGSHPREAQSLTEALLLIVVGSLVPISVATLIFALLTLRKAHLYVVLAEQRFEHLREGQVLLLALLREQSRSSETTEQEHRAQARVLREREPLASAVRTRGIDELGLHGPLWNAGRGADDELGVGSSLPDWPPEDTPGGRERADKEEPPKERGSESRPRAANWLRPS